MTALRKVVDLAGERLEPEHCRVDQFRKAIETLTTEHRPSRMPFFGRLAGAPAEVAP